MSWYLKVLKQYVDFNGRARRKEYWMFALFNFIFGIVAMVLDYVILGMPGPLFLIYTLATLLPALGVLVRRLHDTGKSGWFFFVTFIPLIGGIWLLVLLVSDSTPGQNQYGPSPKG